MKALLVIVILLTFGAIFLHYRRRKDIKKSLIALATFGMILSLAVLGNLTREIIPLFIAHIVLIVGAWGALILYLVRDRYYWWMIFSPIVTIGLFLLLELLTGSRHGVL